MSEIGKSPSPLTWPLGLLAALIVLIFGYLIFARGVDRDLNHDEHQFIAPAALLAQAEALPYRDYPLLHLPNMIVAYAGMIRLTGDVVFGPKLLCFGSSILLMVCLFIVALRQARQYRVLLASCVAALFLLDPLYLYTSGKVWNHEVPAFLLVLAILFHVESFRRNSALWLALSAGVAGLAVGCRLTFAPILVPLALAVFLYPVPIARRWLLAILYTGAATAALAPSLYFLATTPEPFLFGNLQCPRLALLDPENTRVQKTMSVWRKVRFLVKEVLIPSWPIVVAFALAGVRPGITWFRQRSGEGFGNALILLILPFALYGIFAPSRYQYQHCYLLIPLLLLAIAMGLSQVRISSAKLPIFAGVLVFSSAATLLYDQRRDLRSQDLEWISNGFSPDEWFKARAASVGAEIREHSPRGKILTLAPTWVLAGGLQIYPEFATAPFAWRNASFVPAERRPKLQLIAPDDLAAFLATDPPGAILTGVEDEELEAPLLAYAQQHGFRMVKLKRKRTLWLPPSV